MVNRKLTQALPNRTVHRTVLENGIVALAVENPAADIIAARIFVRAGSIWEPPHQAGLAHLLAAVITKGTENLSSLEIAEQVESVGASLGADAAADYFLLSLKTVSADFANLLKLCGELLRHPTFPESEVELERRLTLQAIRSQQEQPFALAFEQLRLSMYKHHPYRNSSLGTEESVYQLCSNDLRQFHSTYFRPDNIVISLAGRIAPDEAFELVNQVFGDWQAPPTPIPALKLPECVPNPSITCVPQESQQSIIMLGYLAAKVTGNFSSHQPSDYAVLKLLNSYLGNGLSSRLFVELREKRGLAYEVSALYPTRRDTSHFVVYMGTAPENTASALEGLKTEVERLCNTYLSGDELQAAKNKLLGQYALGKQTNAQLAQIYGWYEILGLGIEFDEIFTAEVSAVTAALAQETACRYFIEPYISLVGPEKAVSQFSVAANC